MGALTGLKILDFSTLLPGPFATMMLGDLGAEVLRVTAPKRADFVFDMPPVIGGTGVTGNAAWLGRNKKTIALDLKEPASIEAVYRLIEKYDIVLEQFRPGVMDRLGVGYEALSKRNPGLIYCALTGYGQTGPMALRAGHDINYLALSGVMAVAGRESAPPPFMMNTAIADLVGGSLDAVIGILAAAFYRERTGRGQFVDISMLDGSVPLNGPFAMAYLTSDHTTPQNDGTEGRPQYQMFRTADDRYMSVGAMEPKFTRAVFAGLGLDGELDWTVTQEKPALTRAKMTERFLSKTQAEWVEIFQNLDACVEPVLNPEEMVTLPQLQVRDMLPQVELPLNPGKTMLQFGSPIRLSETPPEYRHGGYPAGYHTSEVLTGLGFTQEEISQMSGGEETGKSVKTQGNH